MVVKDCEVNVKIVQQVTVRTECNSLDKVQSCTLPRIARDNEHGAPHPNNSIEHHKIVLHPDNALDFCTRPGLYAICHVSHPYSALATVHQ